MGRAQADYVMIGVRAGSDHTVCKVGDLEGRGERWGKTDKGEKIADSLCTNKLCSTSLCSYCHMALPPSMEHIANQTGMAFVRTLCMHPLGLSALTCSRQAI